MSDTSTQFIRKYKRASKSIWDSDSSTILFLADVADNGDGLEFSYSNYIYLHQDNVGRVLGISISKAMLDQHSEFESKYLEDIEMYAFLLMYIDEITEFCSLFADEFESIFLLEPRDFFEAAEIRWFSIIDNA
ncbi:hypothetical protein [Colwellia piezophila]|uniref:hypothetical protein n=1 Tax=Colwellia piezophila TaxID=211668 RepID=UPI00035D63F7|nr:hypothetical protein [Colwellia piezophila]